MALAAGHDHRRPTIAGCVGLTLTGVWVRYLVLEIERDELEAEPTRMSFKFPCARRGGRTRTDHVSDALLTKCSRASR